MTNWQGERRKHDMRAAILLNGLVFVFLLLLFHPRYEVSDDLQMLSMLGGSKGLPDGHLVYINYLIGGGLLKLYGVLPSVPWFPIFQYLVLFCAFSGVSYIFLRTHERSSALWVLLVPLLVFGYEGYIQLTYTKTAGIAAAASIAMLFWSAFRERSEARTVVAGMLLAVVASMLRLMEFLAVGAVYLGLGVLFLLRAVELPRQEAKRRLLRCAAMFAALLLAVGAMKLVDGAFYTSDEWRYYLRYNAVRTELADYGKPGYEENAETLQAMGIDETALRCCLMDSQRFGAEQLEQIAALKHEPRITRAYLLRFAREMAKGLPRCGAFNCFVFVGICWLLAGKKGRNEWLCAASLGVVLMGLYFYLYYRGRFLKNRVDVGLWMAACLTLIAMLDVGRCERLRRGGTLAALAVAVFAVCCWNGQWRVNSAKLIESQQAQQAVLEAIDSDPEHLYLTMGTQPSSVRSFGIWENVPAGLEDNIYRLGGWMGTTRASRSVLERFGIAELMPAIARDERVLVISGRAPQLAEYIENNYQMRVEAVEVKQIGSYPVYQIREIEE